jgi:hypothetical protein
MRTQDCPQFGANLASFLICFACLRCSTGESLPHMTSLPDRPMTYAFNTTPLLDKQLVLELQPNQLITMTQLTTNLTPKYKPFTCRLILLFST